MFKFFDHWNDVTQLSPYERLVFIFICANQEYCSRTKEDIAEQTGMSKRQVQEAIHKLADKDLIKIVRVTQRHWKLYPQIEKMGAYHAPSDKDYGSKSRQHGSKSRQKREHTVLQNYKGTIKNKVDLKINEVQELENPKVLEDYLKSHGVTSIVKMIGGKK